MLVQRRDALDRLSGEDRVLVAKFWDMAERVGQHGQTEFSGFLDPGQRVLIQGYRHLWPVELSGFGGYEQAERQIMAAVGRRDESGARRLMADHAADQTLSVDIWPLVAVQVGGGFQFAKVSHRDYLGSLLSLGLKRELFGDILVLSTGCQVVLHEQALSFVLSNWSSVGSVGIEVRQIEFSQLQLPERERVERTATVATLRLDAVVAVAYGLSRSKAADLIRAGKVKLNYRPEVRTDRQVDQGAVLSLAGLGRAELLEVGGASKSGRLFIKVGRWH